MAKSLGIRTPAGFTNPDSVEKAVLEPVTPTGNLGGIVSSILEASADAMMVVVDFAARVVHACMAGASSDNYVTEVANTTVVGSLKQFEPGRSAVWIEFESAFPGITINAEDAGILGALVAKPELVKRSIASLVSVIEDALAGETDPLGVAGAPVFMAIDQYAAKVTLIKANNNTGRDALRALFADGGSLEDVARFEQIPAEEAADAATIAFE